MSWIEKEKNVGVVVFSELNSWPCNRFDKKGSDFQSLYQKLALAERKEAGHRFLVCLVFMFFHVFPLKVLYSHVPTMLLSHAVQWQEPVEQACQPEAFCSNCGCDHELFRNGLWVSPRVWNIPKTCKNRR